MENKLGYKLNTKDEANKVEIEGKNIYNSVEFLEMIKRKFSEDKESGVNESSQITSGYGGYGLNNI